MDINAPDVIVDILTGSKTWFVVGLSDNTSRAAYGVADVLTAHGKKVVAIHPAGGGWRGSRGYPTVAEAAAAEGAPDVVDLFINSRLAGAVVDDAIAAGAGAVWLQLGVIDRTAAQRALDAGVRVVMDRCPAIEFARL